MKALILLGLLFPALAFGQSSEISKDFRQPSSQKPAKVDIINRSVQNRALASGLASNAGNINRSVEDLMESIFYSVMDQKIRTKMADTVNLTTAYQRDVEPTSVGTFVVIDRFRFGPEFFKELTKVRGLPLGLRNQSNFFITNVTYRSDALRLHEGAQQSRWREFANNLFGILPLLSSILPPSFNREELYDPISYLQTPFLFPSDAAEALEMPIGNVRSYGLSNSTGLGLDLVGRSVTDLQKDLSIDALTIKLPLTGFYEGEHQISVLHARDNEVWLSVSEIRRLGALLSIEQGKRYQIFQKVFKWWVGVPATIAPIDYDVERARIYQIDEMYTFDLTKASAREALDNALKGKLEQARTLGKTEDPEELLQHGVVFQFRRHSIKNEDTTMQGRSLYVLQNQRQSQLDVGETTTRDRVGEFFSLDTEHIIQDRDWNVLVGPETVEYRLKLSLPVTKEHEPDEEGEHDTVLKMALNTEEQLYLVGSLKIIDNFHDTRDHNRLLGIVRKFSNMPLDTLPEIPIYATDTEKAYFQEQALDNPMDEIYRKQVPPTNLGKMEAYAHLYFGHDLIVDIARRDRKEFWARFAEAFQVDPLYWADEGTDPGWGYAANLTSTYLLFPLRLFNAQTSFSDFAFEMGRIRKALDVLSQSADPLVIIGAYHDLMNTSHPAELMHGLSLLASEMDRPAIVGFTTSSSENKEDSADTISAKKAFSKLNQQVFQSTWPIPPIRRNQTVEEKLAAFQPGGFRNPKKLPKLQRLVLFLTPSAVEVKGKADGEMNAELWVQDPPPRAEKLPVYVRIEQSGVINVGRFVLTEELRDLVPISSGDQRQAIGNVGIYRLHLTGKEGLENQDFLNKAIVENGAFDIFLSLSDQSGSWSTEQNMSFQIENGLLKKLF